MSTERTNTLFEAVRNRILVLDGAMGTMIQAYDFSEEDYRGARFGDHASDLRGNNDLLTLTQPQAIEDIHRQFLEAGADILTTNTFNANRISQADYHLEDLSYELNVEAAKVARRAAAAIEAETPDKPRFVTGALGPTNRTASISPDVNDPGYRNITFDILVEAYTEATKGLLDGGVDLLLIETIFDTLNAKAAIFAVDLVQTERGTNVPVMISGTITDRSGRTLTGQTPEAFWVSVEHGRPFSIGLNCALGPKELRPHVKTLAGVADSLVCIYPNAGLPNEFGGYDETPDDMAEQIGNWAEEGLLNIVGGCCGTTPGHIGAIAKAVDGIAPRRIPKQKDALRLSGLEIFEAGAA